MLSFFNFYKLIGAAITGEWQYKCLHIRSMADCPHNICRLECSAWLSAGICICCKSDLFFLLNPSYLLWTTTAPQLEIPSDPFNSGESKFYEIRKRAPQSIYVFKTTVYRLQTTDYRLQTKYIIYIHIMIYKYTIVYRIFWILDSNLIWPSRGRDVFPGPDWLLFHCLSPTRMEF